LASANFRFNGHRAALSGELDDVRSLHLVDALVHGAQLVFFLKASRATLSSPLNGTLPTTSSPVAQRSKKRQRRVSPLPESVGA
jgi:hypothetical protein